MIIIIILSVLFLISAGLLIYGHLCDDDAEFVGIIATVIFGLILLGSSIACSVANNKYEIEVQKYALQEELKLYQNERHILESYHLVHEGEKTTFTSDITLEVISTSEYYSKVSEYNEKIYKYKKDIKSHQLYKDNPWINWFISPAYRSVTDEELDQLIYTIGKESE